MTACEERVAETERAKTRTEQVVENNRARVERDADDVPMDPGKGKQRTDRHAVASGESERHHDENERSRHLCRSQVMWTMTHTFLSWM